MADNNNNNAQAQQGAADQAQQGAADITLESFNEAQQAWIMQQINSNADRRVNQAQAKWAKDAQRKNSLAGLDGEARARAEVEQRLADLEAENAQLRTVQRTAEVKGVLAAHGLAAEFGDLLKISEDAEENQQTIAQLERLIKAGIAAEVKKRMPTSSVGAGGHAGQQLTREAFNKLSVREQMKIYETDRALYDALTK